MSRIIVTMFLIFHGLLHLIGFAKEWNLTSHHLSRRMLTLAGNPSRFAGTLWLIACILFVSAGIIYLLRKEWYWIPAAAGLVISQTLIVLYWDDAKYGTYINVIILIAVFFSAAAMKFDRDAGKEVQALLLSTRTTKTVVTEEVVAHVPEIVQRWLRASGVIGRSMPNTIRISQQGTLRTTPKGKWMPFEATQHFSLDPPAFVWSANIKAAPLVSIAGLDKFVDGHGNMVIKPMYIINAANSSGAEVDQGTLIRYLAEMSWFPQAALSQYVSWETIDDDRVRATITYGGISASGIYSINRNGRVTGFEALRYGDFQGEFRKELWSVAVKGYREFDGVNVGAASEVTWKLKEGNFTWLKVELTSIVPLN